MKPSSDRGRVSARNLGGGKGTHWAVARHVLVRRQGGGTVVVLHGYAGDAEQTHRFFLDWIEAIDDSSFLFLEGATPCCGIGGFGWLPLTSDQATLADSLQGLAPLVERYIARVLREEGLGRNVWLVGHSQGAMLALEMVARAKLVVQRAIAISGMYPLPERMPKGNGRAPCERVEVEFVHESDDPMIPLRHACKSERAFSERGFSSRMTVLEGGQHVLSRAYAGQVLALMLTNSKERRD